MTEEELNEPVGKTFGRLHIDKFAYSDHKSRRYYHCTCSCGKKTITQYSLMFTGQTKSCGCYMREKNGNRSRKHGKLKHPIYHMYNHILGRCYNKNNESYKHYGGRGIKMCDEWRNDFMAFYNWAIENGFSNEKSERGRRLYSIDRIDVNGDYCPENCRFADNLTQGNNKQNSLRFTYNNETHTIKEWCEITGMKQDTLYYRLKNWSTEDALTRKIMNKGEI